MAAWPRPSSDAKPRPRPQGDAVPRPQPSGGVMPAHPHPPGDAMPRPRPSDEWSDVERTALMAWSFVCHVHTGRSGDSMTSAASIVRRALRLGIDVLAITDHDTWQGAVDALGVVSRTAVPL